MLFLLFFTAVVVGFDTSIYTVSEGDGQAELCVNITVPRQQDIGTVTFNLTVETQNGSAGIASNPAQSQAFYFNFSPVTVRFFSKAARQNPSGKHWFETSM